MKKLTMAVFAMLALGATEVAAQTTGQATVNIPQVLEISAVTELNIAEGAFDFSTANSSTASGTVTVDTRGNVPHAVNVALLSGDLADANSNTLGLSVQTTTNGVQPLGATALEVLDYTTRGVQSGTVQFEATAALDTEAPGAYSGQITYTVVAK